MEKETKLRYSDLVTEENKLSSALNNKEEEIENQIEQEKLRASEHQHKIEEERLEDLHRVQLQYEAEER